MANIDNLKKKYALSGDTYDAAAADAALSDLYAVSRKLALLNRDMEARIAALESEKADTAAKLAEITSERDELAAFKAGEALAAVEVKREIEKLEDENSALRGRISTLNEMVDTLEKEKSVLSREHGDAASENERLAALNLVLSTDNETLTDELSALKREIDSLEADNSRLSIGISGLADRTAPVIPGPAAAEEAAKPADADEEVLSIARAFSEEIGEDEKKDGQEVLFPESIPAVIPEEIGEKKEEGSEAEDIFGKLAAALTEDKDYTDAAVTAGEPAVPAVPAEEQPADGEDPLEAELRRVLDVQNAAAKEETSEKAPVPPVQAKHAEAPKAEIIGQESIFDDKTNPYGFEDAPADAGKTRSIGDMKSRLESIRNRKN